MTVIVKSFSFIHSACFMCNAACGGLLCRAQTPQCLPSPSGVPGQEGRASTYFPSPLPHPLSRSKALLYSPLYTYLENKPLSPPPLHSVGRTCRGDWGTLRRKNSNPQNIDLIFKIKYFDDTYGYSIQWGIFEQEMKMIKNV